MTEYKEIPNPIPDKIHRDLASGLDSEKALLAKNIFIEAGAGTGKTETIVRRILNQLYSNSDLTMANVSAITFTEKAAAELRSRFRSLLEKDITKGEVNVVRAQQLLETLDMATIGTIHSFAKNILSVHCVAAGIPVGFQISNESSGESLRVARARLVVDNLRANLTQSDRELFYEISFDATLMQDVVEALDQKSTRLVGGFKFDDVSNPETYQQATFRFIRNAYSELQTQLEQRRKNGTIEFDDLLILTLRLLSGNSQVRGIVHETYKILVVDEFQDTDPVQWEIVKLITCDPLDDLRVPLPGRLAVVGDPKQAIYAFRGGDINTYLSARSEFPTFGERLNLTSNFRSTKGILDFINHAFQDRFREAVDNPLHMGVDYQALHNIHNPEHEEPGPSVLLIDEPETKEDWSSLLGLSDPTDEILEKAIKAFNPKNYEMKSTALAIRKAIDEQWQVTGKAPELGFQRIFSRPASYSDVCVLVPVRTHLKTLLKEFEAAGVPYRSTDPSIVYNRPLIAGIRDAISVIAKSDDQAKIWGALKSPLFGFSDQTLFNHRESGGHWYVGKNLKGGVSEVNRALELMHELSEASKSSNPAWLISELISRQELFLVLLDDDLGEFEASCLRMVISHAEQWLSDGNIGLLSYLSWVNTMLGESTRESLPGSDDLDLNAVEIMTIHASKGLEFPITVVTGLASTMKPDRPKLHFVPASADDDIQIEFSLSKIPNSKNYFCSTGYESFHKGGALQATMEELSRLIYVACTRAKDHLILSTLAKRGDGTSLTSSRGIRLAHARVNFTDYFKVFEGHSPLDSGDFSRVKDYQEIRPEYINWLAEFRSAAAKPVMRSPSSHESNKVFAKSEIPAQTKNADFPDGRPLGRAVHGVMELVMLGAGIPTSETLDKFIKQMIEKEQAEEQEEEIRERIGKLLENKEILESLSTENRWPELHLAKKVDEGSIRFIEGFADLVYKAADGYVLVDYKTDADLEPALDHYKEQLGAYASIIEEVTGEKMARVLIIHARNDEAETRPLTY